MESWAGGSDAFVLLETEVGWAGELLADAVFGFDATFWADLAEALAGLQGGVLWTNSSNADSVHEGESGVAGLSDALSSDVLEESWAAGGLEALATSDDSVAWA